MSNNNQQQSNLKYWLGFNQIRKLTPIKFQKLIDGFDDLKTAWGADLAQLLTAGLEEKLAHEIIKTRSAINPDQELKKLEVEGVKAICIANPIYPKLLKEIFDPPSIIYYRGSLKCFEKSALAVVGTRKFSLYGQQAVAEITTDLTRQNITIVSGLALGIDALAHTACLEAGGLTAAVLGSSVDWDNVLPATNKNLAKRIIDSGGCVLSEYPIKTPPSSFTYPARNRIISGLSLGTIVIEAKDRSGTLITARMAGEQGRDVFAVPGSIFNPNSQGTNNLIKKGAMVITNADDAIDALNLRQAMKTTVDQKPKPTNSEEELILSYLSKEPIHIDKLAQSCNIKINVLMSTITSLELRGAIKDLGGKNYIIK